MKNHRCTFPEGKGELAREAALFSLKGLASGAFVFGSLESEDFVQFFSALGKTKSGKSLLERAIGRNQLAVRIPSEAYFPSGKFVPAELLRRIELIHGRSIKSGFSGTFFFGTASFILPEKGVPGANRFFEYEAMVNGIFRGKPRLNALCIYEREIFGKELLKEALRIHS